MVDLYDNFVVCVGMQQFNQYVVLIYRVNYISCNCLFIEWVYCFFWIIGVVVDLKVDDMIKKGVWIISEIDLKCCGILELWFDEFQFWDCINEMLKWFWLYGGVVVLILIEGQVLLMLLVLDKVGKGSFKGLVVFDCWMINLQFIRCIKVFGFNFGKFEFYDIVIMVQGLFVWIVYYSCLICMDGVKLLYQQKIIENEWGMFIVECIFDCLIFYDSISVGVVQFVYKVYL